MAIQSASIGITGVGALLMNNPQTVDRFNGYARKIADINAKKTRRTDEDYLELRRLEVESKLYFDDDLGVYVPSSWLLQSLVDNGFKVAKIDKKRTRGGVFTTAQKCKLHYAGMDKVKAPDDVIMNHDFQRLMNIKQGQVRVMKACPCFTDWSFSTVIEYDDAIMDARDIKKIIEFAAKYNGFGDFRPTFGRATGVVQNA